MLVFRLILGVKSSRLIFQLINSEKAGTRVMDRKPDIIRAIVLIFAVGLVITGFTSIQASEDKRSFREVPVTSFVQSAGQRLNR